MNSMQSFFDRSDRLSQLAHAEMGKWITDEMWALGARDLLQETFGNFKFDPFDLLEACMFRSGPKPTFPSLGFSHHPLTLWSTQDMSLDLYYWHPGDTTMHDHGFHGAFMPVLGDYAETEYHFEKKFDLGPGIEVGDLRGEEMEILTNGQAVAIYHAPAFIHQVTHQSFCVTMCLRSRFTGLELSDYYFPGIKVSTQSQLVVGANEDLQRFGLLYELKPSKVAGLLTETPMGTLTRWWLKGVTEGHHKELKAMLKEELLKREHGKLIIAAAQLRDSHYQDMR